MHVLIVHAHPEPASFNSAMTRRAAEVLTATGHEVTVSDLYAMRFDLVSDRRNFTTVADPRYLQLQTEEIYAAGHESFVPELQAEMDKVGACDLLILQFPIWWLGPPAILKGWIDRVFACGHAYGSGRYFEGGLFRGKRAMCSVTVGGPKDAYSESGVYAEAGTIRFPIHRGIFGFTGFTVIEPFVVYAPARILHEERQSYLDRYRERLLNLDVACTIPSPSAAMFEGGAFRPATQSVSSTGRDSQ